MITLTFPGKIDSGEVIDLFTRVVGNVEYSSTHTSGQCRIDIVAGSKYFFRTNDVIGLFLTLFYDGVNTKVDGGRIGGGSGLLRIRFGAGNKLEEELTNGLDEIASK